MRDSEPKTKDIARKLRRSMTRAEALLWTILRRGQLHGAHFRRQHPIGPYVADFACASAKLVIELDGATHWTPEQLAHDARRTMFIEERGWRVMRFLNTDVFDHSDGVWDTIAANLPRPSRASRATPPPQAGEELSPATLTPPPFTGEVPSAARGRGRVRDREAKEH